PVAAPAGDRFAVRREGDRADAIAVAGEGLLELAGGGVPELDQLVAAAAGQRGTVGREGERRDPDRLVLQLVAELAGGEVPDQDLLVRPCGGEQFAVGGEGDGVCFPLRVTGQRLDALPRFHVEDTDQLVHVKARGRQGAAVRRKADPASIAVPDCSHEYTGLRVVEADASLAAGGRHERPIRRDRDRIDRGRRRDLQNELQLRLRGPGSRGAESDEQSSRDGHEGTHTASPGKVDAARVDVPGVTGANAPCRPTAAGPALSSLPASTTRSRA